MQALRTATTGMAAQQLNVEVISNNIANMNTVGYKRRRAEFQDLLYETLQRAGAQSSDQGTVVPTGLQIGTGVKAGSIYRITEQGSMTQTGNKLDVAIQGRGYLQVLMPTGEIAYTRAGNLSLNDQGQVVTADGYQIQPAIVIPPDAVDISISKSGQVQVQQAGQTAPSIVGNLELATFVNEGGLEAIGDNLYLESGASGAPTLSVPGVDGAGALLQGVTDA
jgi:flagellar basal-body rod protein FlgG